MDVAHLCARLAEFGVGPRHLRTLRTSADKAGLIEAVTAPALLAERSGGGGDRGPCARSVSSRQELSTLLLWRRLTGQAGE